MEQKSDDTGSRIFNHIILRNRQPDKYIRQVSDTSNANVIMADLL